MKNIMLLFIFLSFGMVGIASNNSPNDSNNALKVSKKGVLIVRGQEEKSSKDIKCGPPYTQICKEVNTDQVIAIRKDKNGVFTIVLKKEDKSDS